MSGFSTTRSGIENISKQYGSVLRGWGPPVPKAGVIGDLYMDVMTYQLFEKRSTGSLDDWGHYLFILNAPYRDSLKWFGPSRPSNSLGVQGDYFLQWAGYNNYGMHLTIFGPKLIYGWPENGEGPISGGPIITDYNVYPLGVADEGPARTDVAPNQLIAVGIFDEYVIPLTVTANPGDPVLPIGAPGSGQLVFVTINPLYTAVDEHAI